MAVERYHPVAGAEQHRPDGGAVQRRVIGVDDPQPYGIAGRGIEMEAMGAVDGDAAAVSPGVHDERVVARFRDSASRQDHQRPEEPAGELVEGVLVGVIPVGPDVIGDELIDVRAAGPHCILGYPGDAVLRVRQAEAVPVDGGPVGQVVDQRHPDPVALDDA